MKEKLFYSYNDFLKNKYGEKVIKLTIDQKTSCPNRDQGFPCTFCDDQGTLTKGPSQRESITHQLEENKSVLSKKYHANKFIAYFQNFTNTYLPLDIFEKRMREAAKFPDVVMLSLSTRPDCIKREYLDILKHIKESYNVDICIELGLQSINPQVLSLIQRGHSLAEYIESILLIKSYGYLVSTHLILNLPGDDLIHTIEAAKILSVLQTDFVKIHSLHISKNSILGKSFLEGDFEIESKETYYHRVGTFLNYLSPKVVVERLFSRFNEERALFHNWDVSGWQMHNEIRDFLMKHHYYQGKCFDYLGGKGLRKYEGYNDIG